MSLYEKLKTYNRSDVYPFHMPGHKRNPRSLPEDFPVGMDITEITGFDDLHEAEGVILEAEENAAALYGSEKCKFLVGGSTSGILAAILGVTERGDTILMGRNCHKSVYSAVFLNDLHPLYLSPEDGEKLGIKAQISPADVENALKHNRAIKCVVIVSPSYEGITSDVKAIADCCHAYGVPLMVDAAHGAHLGMNPHFPESAVKSGADIVVMSLHKTLPALTGTALLHMQGNRISCKKILKSLARVMTSSPSYVFMANMDYLVRDLRKNGEAYFAAYKNHLEAFYARTKLEKLSFLRGEHVDPGKITILTQGTSLTGKALHSILRDRFQLELEMASPTFAIAMTSYADTWEGFLRLSEALIRIDGEIEKRDNTDVIYYLPEPKAVLSLREAEEKAEDMGTDQVALQAAEGEVSAVFAYIYPPGTPILAPGEVITRDVIDVVKSCENSLLRVLGTQDGKIEVLRKGK